MRTILTIFMIIFLASCSKEKFEFNSKYSGTYEGNVTIQTASSGQLYCQGKFTVSSDGTVKGEVYNIDKTYKKTYSISSGYMKKVSNIKYNANVNEFGFKIDFIFIFADNAMNLEIKDYTEGSITKGNMPKK